MRKATLLIMVSIILLGTVNVSFSKEVSFAQEDRDRLIRFETKLEEGLKATNQRIEALEKSVDNHFEQIDKRFEFMQNLMIAMLAVFGSLCGVFAGLLLWDRKTFMEKAKDNAMKEIEEKYKINSWLEALKEFSKTHNDLADIMKRLHL